MQRDISDTRFRSPDHRVVRLRKAKAAEVNRLWNDFDSARSEFALGYKRSNYNRLKAAGEALVAAQTEAGVWLIHPANVGPGLREDDPRIVEDCKTVVAD